MTYMLTTAAVLALAFQAQPTSQDGGDQSTDAQTQEVAETGATDEGAIVDEERIICKRTAITGSKFKKKLCGTQAQWDELENRSAENAGDLQRKGKGLSPNAR